MNAENAVVAEQLSACERAALDQFRAAVADLSPPCREDWYLLKWLRARKFDLDDATRMLREHIAWRKKYQVETFLDDYKVPELFRNHCPGGFVDCAPGGQPVYISPTGNADIKGLLEAASRSDFIRHLIYILETQEELKRRISLQNGGRRVETMYVVVDMEGFSFWQLSSIEDGWKDVLAARFDLERLPAHWGGRLRGPDGDGRCRHLICPGGPVPEKYRRKWCGTEGTRSCTVGAGCCWSLPVSVDHAGSELRWKFNTASGDVAFSVRFRPFRTTTDGEKETRDLVVAKRLPSSNTEPHRGSLCCNEPGTYELVFDNSFSWLTRKELSYSVELLPPDAQRKKPDDAAREVKD